MSHEPRGPVRRFAEYLLVFAVLVAVGALGLWRIKVVKGYQEAPGEIRYVLDAQVAAWNRGDLDGFMAGYWNSDEMTFCSGGTVTKGWQATLDRYRKRYQADGKEMGKLTFDDVRIEVITSDVALVRGRWKLDLSTGKPEGLFTLQMKRLPEGWRVVYDHTSAADK